MMDWYLQYVSAHAYVVLEIECCKFVDCICVVSVICVSLINFINVKISFQGGAVYISGGGGSCTFDSCSFDGNTAGVSTHDNIGFEIECSKFVDGICFVSVICF